MPLTTFDTRWVITGSGITTPTLADQLTLGGSLIQLASTGTLTFTPSNACDRFRVKYARASGFGTIRLMGTDGATVSAAKANAMDAVAEITLSGTPGDALIVSRGNTGNVQILELECWNSAVKEVMVLNADWAAALSYDLIGATKPWSPLNMTAQLAPHLILIEGGLVNNANLAVIPANTEAELTALVTAAKAAGPDVILVIPPPLGG